LWKVLGITCIIIDNSSEDNRVNKTEQLSDAGK
jgi:hypothetical protein